MIITKLIFLCINIIIIFSIINTGKAEPKGRGKKRQQNTDSDNAGENVRELSARNSSFIEAKKQMDIIQDYFNRAGDEDKQTESELYQKAFNAQKIVNFYFENGRERLQSDMEILKNIKDLQLPEAKSKYKPESMALKEYTLQMPKNTVKTNSFSDLCDICLLYELLLLRTDLSNDLNDYKLKNKFGSYKTTLAQLFKFANEYRMNTLFDTVFLLYKQISSYENFDKMQEDKKLALSETLKKTLRDWKISDYFSTVGTQEKRHNKILSETYNSLLKSLTESKSIDNTMKNRLKKLCPSIFDLLSRNTNDLQWFMGILDTEQDFNKTKTFNYGVLMYSTDHNTISPINFNYLTLHESRKFPDDNELKRAMGKMLLDHLNYVLCYYSEFVSMVQNLSHTQQNFGKEEDYMNFILLEFMEIVEYVELFRHYVSLMNSLGDYNAISKFVNTFVFYTLQLRSYFTKFIIEFENTTYNDNNLNEAIQILNKPDNFYLKYLLIPNDYFLKWFKDADNRYDVHEKCKKLKDNDWLPVNIETLTMELIDTTNNSSSFKDKLLRLKLQRMVSERIVTSLTEWNEFSNINDQEIGYFLPRTMVDQQKLHYLLPVEKEKMKKKLRTFQRLSIQENIQEN